MNLKDSRLWQSIESRIEMIREKLRRDKYDDDDYDGYDPFGENRPWYKEKKPLIALALTIVLAIPLFFFAKDKLADNTEDPKPIANMTETVKEKKLASQAETSITMSDFHRAIQTGDGRDKYENVLKENTSIQTTATRELPEIDVDVTIVKLADGYILTGFKNNVIIFMQDFTDQVSAKDYITELIKANTDDESKNSGVSEDTVSDDEDESSSDKNKNDDNKDDIETSDTDDDEIEVDGVELPSKDDLEKAEKARIKAEEELEAVKTDTESLHEKSNAQRERELQATTEKEKYKAQLAKEKEAREKAEEKIKKAKAAKKKAEEEAEKAKSEAEKAELKQLRAEAEKAQRAAEEAARNAQSSSNYSSSNNNSSGSSSNSTASSKSFTASNFRNQIRVGMSTSTLNSVTNRNNWSRTTTIGMYGNNKAYIYKTKDGAYMLVGVNGNNKITTVRETNSLADAKAVAKSIKYQNAYNANKAIANSISTPKHDDAPIAQTIEEDLAPGTKLSKVKAYAKQTDVQHIATFDIGGSRKMYVYTAYSGFVCVSVNSSKVTDVYHASSMTSAVNHANNTYKD